MSKVLGVMASPVLNRSWFEGECTLRFPQCLAVTLFPERIKKTSLVRKNLVYLKPYLCQPHLSLIYNPAKRAQTDRSLSKARTQTDGEPGLSVQVHAPAEGCCEMSRKQPGVVAFLSALHSVCRTAVTTSKLSWAYLCTHVCTCGH